MARGAASRTASPTNARAADRFYRPSRERHESLPSISVVIPTYNRSALVSRAVKSALAQIRPAKEILVVDNGSVDDTEDVINGFGPPVRYLRQDNKGASAARNRGVKAATGDWIAFLDSDDVWEPVHLKAMSDAIVATDGGAVLYFADAIRPPGSNPATCWAASGFSATPPHALVADGSAWVVGRKHPMMLPACVVERKTFLEEGGFHEGLRSREDSHLFYRLAIGRPVCAVASPSLRITQDDSTGGRLTDRYGARSAAYWEATVLLTNDILARVHRLQLGPQITRAFKADLAEAHWRLARGLVRDRRYREGAVHLIAAMRASPVALARRRATRLSQLRRPRSRRDRMARPR